MRILLVLAFIFTIAFADRDGGPYLGVGYGISEYKDDGKYDGILEKNSDLIFFYAGAYINKHLSVELGYAKMQSSKYKVEHDSKNLEVGYSLHNISTLAHYAFFDERLDLYIKFGAGFIKSSNEDGSSFIYGIGSSLRLNELLSVKFAYDIYEFGYDENANGTSNYDMKIHYPYIGMEFQF